MSSLLFDESGLNCWSFSYCAFMISPALLKIRFFGSEGGVSVVLSGCGERVHSASASASRHARPDDQRSTEGQPVSLPGSQQPQRQVALTWETHRQRGDADMIHTCGSVSGLRTSWCLWLVEPHMKKLWLFTIWTAAHLEYGSSWEEATSTTPRGLTHTHTMKYRPFDHVTVITFVKTEATFCTVWFDSCW